MKGIMVASLAGVLAIAGGLASPQLQDFSLGDRLTGDHGGELMSRGSYRYQLQRYTGGTGRREILS